MKDSITLITGLIGFVLGLPAVYLGARAALREIRFGNAEKAKSNRIQMALAAKGLLDEIQNNESSFFALQQLDWQFREYDNTFYKGKISEDAMLHALRVYGDDFSPLEVVIRDAFDSLFHKLALLDHFISIGLVDAGDIVPPLNYYLQKIMLHRERLAPFLNAYDYSGVLRLAERSTPRQANA